MDRARGQVPPFLSASVTAPTGKPSCAIRPLSTATRISGVGTPQAREPRTPGTWFIRSRKSFEHFSSRRYEAVSLTSANCSTEVSVVRVLRNSSRASAGGSVPRIAFTSRTSSS
jgi:hypothetical protein